MERVYRIGNGKLARKGEFISLKQNELTSHFHSFMIPLILFLAIIVNSNSISISFQPWSLNSSLFSYNTSFNYSFSLTSGRCYLIKIEANNLSRLSSISFQSNISIYFSGLDKISSQILLPSHPLNLSIISGAEVDYANEIQPQLSIDSLAISSFQLKPFEKQIAIELDQLYDPFYSLLSSLEEGATYIITSKKKFTFYLISRSNRDSFLTRILIYDGTNSRCPLLGSFYGTYQFEKFSSTGLSLYVVLKILPSDSVAMPWIVAIRDAEISQFGSYEISFSNLVETSSYEAFWLTPKEKKPFALSIISRKIPEGYVGVTLIDIYPSYDTSNAALRQKIEVYDGFPSAIMDPVKHLGTYNYAKVNASLPQFFGGLVRTFVTHGVDITIEIGEYEYNQGSDFYLDQPRVGHSAFLRSPWSSLSPANQSYLLRICDTSHKGKGSQVTVAFVWHKWNEMSNLQLVYSGSDGKNSTELVSPNQSNTTITSSDIMAQLNGFGYINFTILSITKVGFQLNVFLPFCFLIMRIFLFE